MVGLFKDAVESEAAVALAPGLLALVVLLLVAEVFVRRFLSGPRLRKRKPVVEKPLVRPSAPKFAPGSTAATPVALVAAPPSSAAAPIEPPPPEPKPSAPTVQDALAAARDRAKKRTGR